MESKIKIILTALVISLAFFHCSTEKSNEPLPDSKNKTEIKIDADKVLKDYSSEITGKLLNLDILKDINGKTDYKVKFVDYYNAYYLHGRGFDKDGGHVIFRQKVEITKSKDGSQTLKILPDGESCTGVNCSKCSFASDGGCDCDRAGDPAQASYCNHTTSTGG